MTASVAFLHGFSGEPSSADAVVAALRPAPEVVAPALLGHGATDDRDVTTFEGEVDRIASLLAGIRPAPHLVGYSLGGRVAVGLLARHPGLVSGATLIGAQAGLRTDAERAERRHADEHLCQILERLGIDVFVAKWESIPLFASQRALPEPILARQRASRLRRDPRELARSLRVTGLGAMPCYWDVLDRIQVPVTLMTGALDEKFTEIAKDMAREMPRARTDVVPGVGHNVMLEAPDRVARAIERALAEGRQGG